MGEMNTRKVYKWNPYRNWEVDSYENWLKEEAKKGLILKKVGLCWATFEKAEPQVLEYRLTFSKEKIPEAIRALYEWEQISTPGLYNLYVSNKAGKGDPLYMSHEVELEEIETQKNKYERSIFWEVMFILLIGTVMIYQMMQRYFILSLVQNGISVMGILILIQIHNIYQDMRQYRALGRLEARFKGIEDLARDSYVYKKKNLERINTTM